MRAAPREETGVSAAEAALQQQLVVPGQLPLPSERPVDMEELPVPPVVIPPTVCSYAQAVASSPLDGADWVYDGQGGGPAAHGRQVQRPLQGVGEGEQGLEAAGGGESGGGQQGPPEAPLGQRGPEGGCAADTWEAEDGLSGSGGFLFFSREARGACVADTRIDEYSNKYTILYVQ